MRKKIRICLLILLQCAILLFLSSCSGSAATVEDVNVEFWYSNDGGVTYFQGDGYHRGWGESFFMKLRVQVHTDSNKATFPTISLYIGDSDNISAYIIGGAVVTPRIYYSYIKYDFTARAVKNNDKFTELFVEFIPHRPGIIEMEVEITHNDNRLDEFKKKHTLDFLCICESIDRNLDGVFDNWNPEDLNKERQSCVCEKDCGYCFPK